MALAQILRESLGPVAERVRPKRRPEGTRLIIDNDRAKQEQSLFVWVLMARVFQCFWIPTGLRLVRWPLSVPSVGSMTQSIRLGLPDVMAADNAWVSSAGVVAR